jgi:hypothetical protein
MIWRVKVWPPLLSCQECECATETCLEFRVTHNIQQNTKTHTGLEFVAKQSKIQKIDGQKNEIQRKNKENNYNRHKFGTKKKLYFENTGLYFTVFFQIQRANICIGMQRFVVLLWVLCNILPLHTNRHILCVCFFAVSHHTHFCSIIKESKIGDKQSALEE